MKQKRYIFVLIIAFVLEAVLCLYFLGKMEEVKNDPVMINECRKSVEVNYGNPSEYVTGIDYVVVDNDGNIVFKTRDGLSESINDAVRSGETILDITSGDQTIGKMLIHDDTMSCVREYRNRIAITVVMMSLVQITVLIVFYLSIKRKILDPFDNMKAFAARVACGDLDFPLTIDRKHVFGSFTEAFDLMRSEIRSARISEKKANDDKKEMVAKLSHDIKTPIASIKSTSEIGYELASESRIKEYFNLINVKSDQITVLVDNLFNSSVNDITEIPVEPDKYDSSILYDLIRNSDHLGKAGDFTVPSCNIYADKIRLQQALDNLFMNSYKYADTPIDVSVIRDTDYLKVKIKDHGQGVSDEELPLLKNKYERGANASDKDGAGLGLYLTNYFMEHMEGKLILENEDDGFAAILCIRTI